MLASVYHLALIINFQNPYVVLVCILLKDFTCHQTVVDLLCLGQR